MRVICPASSRRKWRGCSAAQWETIGHHEREQAAITALATLRAEVDRDGSRAAEAVSALAAVRRERDEAKALASEGAAAVGRLELALVTEQSEREKAEAAARTSSEATVAHLGQLQRLREERYGTVFVLLLSVYPLFFMYIGFRGLT